jgi:CheY-like chemotaxis protein
MSKTVLIADDEAKIARLAQINLMRAGFEVMTAADGVEALASIEQRRPDLLILDVMMPHMDGFTVLERLRADPKTADLPVVMMSAQTKDADLLRAQHLGVAHYLPKPVNPAELLRVVQEELEAGD